MESQTDVENIKYIKQYSQHLESSDLTAERPNIYEREFHTM
jgi:hypothetical protein